MGLPPSGIVTVRLAARDADAIDRLVAEGQFTSRSDFIRYAVKAAVVAMSRDGDDAALDPLAGPGLLPEPGGAGRGSARGGRRSKQGVKQS